MKRALLLTLALALLLAVPAAHADTWALGEDLFMNQLNDDIQRNDSAAHLYTGTTTISGMYQSFTCPDGCSAMVYPDTEQIGISEIRLYCEDVDCVRRRMDDVAYLAYCFGSRDSVQAVSDWCDEWYGPVCNALNREQAVDAAPCDCAAFEANMRVYQNDAEVWILQIQLAM